MKNYADRGGCYPPGLKAEVDNTLRRESLDWSNSLVILVLSATHFRESRHARLIRGCFSFSQCFLAGVFSSLSPLPLTSPISSSLREVLTWRFCEQIARSGKTPALQANSVRYGFSCINVLLHEVVT